MVTRSVKLSSALTARPMPPDSCTANPRAIAKPPLKRSAQAFCRVDEICAQMSIRLGPTVLMTSGTGPAVVSSHVGAFLPKSGAFGSHKAWTTSGGHASTKHAAGQLGVL